MFILPLPPPFPPLLILPPPFPPIPIFSPPEEPEEPVNNFMEVTQNDVSYFGEMVTYNIRYYDQIDEEIKIISRIPSNEFLGRVSGLYNEGRITEIQRDDAIEQWEEYTTV